LKAHPATFVRPALAAEGVVMAGTLAGRAERRSVMSVAGLVLVRQRPGSAKGVIFMTLEDETGIANVIIWPKIFEAHRSIVLGARFVKVTGRLQAEDNVIHLVAAGLEDRTALLTSLGEDEWDVLDGADEVKHPGVDLRTVVKPRSRLACLIDEAPELSGDLNKLLETNVSVVESLAAHKAAAKSITAGRGPPPAPSAAWGTARSAANDVARLGARRGAAKSALPKGRNFH